MKAKWLVVIAIIVAVIFLAPQLGQLGQMIGGGDGGGKSFQVAMIYLYNGVVDNNPQATANKLKSLCEVQGSFSINGFPANSYSVKSFYQKYGVNLYFSYQYAKVAKQISYGTLTTAKTGEEMIEMVIVNWVRENPSKYYSTYDNSNILFFVVKTPLKNAAYWGRAALAGYCWVTDYNDLAFNNPEYMRFAIAHEIAHLFGAKDHYSEYPGNGLNDANCLMNHGGDGAGHLSKPTSVNGVVYFPNSNTIFGKVDLTQDLHLSWAKKVPRDYFMKVNTY